MAFLLYISIYISVQMIFGIAAKWMIGHEASVLSGDLWKNFDAFNQGLLSFPLYIPGTAFYKCMQVYLPIYHVLTD
jgi:hypothetical protein